VLRRGNQTDKPTAAFAGPDKGFAAPQRLTAKLDRGSRGIPTWHTLCFSSSGDTDCAERTSH
jgi:hypothetical protein